MIRMTLASALATAVLALPASAMGAFGDTPCHSCHVWDDCNASSGQCGSCHDLPPATGAHLAHFNGSQDTLTYGDLRITSDFSDGQPAAANLIGCGNCHPLDAASHGNGVWGDIELADPAAPSGTMKSLNGTASYDPATGTCSNVYCHSATSWTTAGMVEEPWPPLSVWDPAVDPLPRPLPENIVSERVYRQVSWFDGEELSCDGCHGNSPQTEYATNSGGAGDSHYWVDDYGYENLHVWNHGFEAIGCRTCHYETVREASTTAVDSVSGRRIYQDVPLHDRAMHVNGRVDVAFDTVNGFTYNTSSGELTYDFAGASYDPDTHTCSNVGCHKTETTVIWGAPYRWWNGTECDRCHGYY